MLIEYVKYKIKKEDCYFQCCDSEDHVDSSCKIQRIILFWIIQIFYQQFVINHKYCFHIILEWAKVNHKMNIHEKELDESMASKLLKSLGMLEKKKMKKI